MKVSVLISNYNYARYLRAAINSVLAQTYSEYEVIVVDDGSTDNSHDVIRQLQQETPDKVNPIFQENRGQGTAFNNAFEASSGEIIAFLDADDIWKPNKLQRVMEAFDTPDVVGVMHQSERVDSKGNIIYGGSSNRKVLSEDLARLIVDTGNTWRYPPTSALAYRRSALEKVLPMDPVKWQLCADGCLVYCTAFLGKIKTLNEVLMSYRIHGANNHASFASKRKAKYPAGTEMTNRYINDFLESIGYPERVDLSRNLDYRRKKYYLQEKFDAREIWAVSGLILRWPFYTRVEKAKYLARFLVKSVGLYLFSKIKSNRILG